MKQMTPKQIVKELDRYIIGQTNAKKAVAISKKKILINLTYLNSSLFGRS